MPTPTRLTALTRCALVLLVLTAALAAEAQPTYCAPATPTPNDDPRRPDNPPSCGLRECERCNASPCFAKTGVYTTGATDLQIPTNGFPLTVSRSYESSHVVDGPLGYGWRSNFAARLYYATYLLAAPSTYWKEAVIVMPDGESYRFTENANGTFTPPTGRRDTLVKLADQSFQLTLERSNVRYAFAADGALVSIKDEYGNTLSFTHDATRRVTRVDDLSGTGRYLTVTWNPAGRIGSVQDNGLRTITYSYGTNGTLTGVTNAASQTTSYLYEQRRFAPQLSQVTDHWNRVLASVTWDSLDRVATYSELGETYTMQYLPPQPPAFPEARTLKTHSKGTQTITYDTAGLVTSRGDGSSTYDTNGDLLTTVDGRNYVTRYTYLSDGRIATLTRGDTAYGVGAVTFHYTYDTAYPYKIAKIEPRVNYLAGSNYHGHHLGWKYTYYGATDPAPGALKQVERLAYEHNTQNLRTPAGDPTSLYAQYAYDAQGRVTSSWTRGEGTTTYVYNDVNRTVQVTLPANNNLVRTTTTTFDTLGRTVSVEDAQGNVTSYQYDNVDRVTSVTLPKPSAASTLNFVTTSVYDQAGANPDLNYTHTTDLNGRITKQGHDRFGRLVESIDALGNKTTYAYADGLLASITDANNNVTSYAYDGFRRLQQTTFPNATTESYTYWPDGLLKTKTDRKGATTNYNYNAFSVLSSQSTGTTTRSFTYEGEKLTQVADNYAGTMVETTLYTYDPKTFLMLSETQGLTAATPNTRGRIDYAWDPGTDRLDSYTVTDGAFVRVLPETTYTYWADGSVKKIEWSHVSSGAFNFSYNANGQQTGISFPNGQSRNFTYDNQGRLTRIRNLLNANTSLATFDYEYDKDNATGLYTVLGQRTKATAVVPSLWSTPAVTEYRYDANYQLTGATTTGGTSAVRSWTYDAIGNRLTQTVGAGTTSYTYLKNGTNPLNGSRLSQAGSNPAVHDANGNMTTFTYTYTWDVLDRLASRDVGGTFNFKYDYQNRRVGIDYQTTRYIYRGLDPVMVGFTKNGTYYENDYLYGPGIDEPLARVDYLGITYYAVDGLGSVILLNDAQGTVKNKYSYAPFGELLSHTENVTQPFGYTGREFAVMGKSPADSQYYYRARYLEPGIGRFLSEDPIGFVGGINFYTYVLNSPAALTDPLGLHPGSSAPCCGRYRTTVPGHEDVGLVRSFGHRLGGPANTLTFVIQCPPHFPSVRSVTLDVSTGAPPYAPGAHPWPRWDIRTEGLGNRVYRVTVNVPTRTVMRDASSLSRIQLRVECCRDN